MKNGHYIQVAFSIILLFIPSSSYAQRSDITFEHLSTKDGLPFPAVFDIWQGKTGFMWFGTFDGLTRYDGYEFKDYKIDPYNPCSMSDNFVSTLYIDKSGTVWIGTSEGLLGFDPVTEKFTCYVHDPGDEQSIISGRIFEIFEDRNKRLWIGSNSGLSLLDAATGNITTVTHFSDSTGLNHNRVTSFEQAPDSLSGVIWIGTNLGLDKFDIDRNQFTHYVHDPNDEHSITYNWISFLKFSRTGKLWVGTSNGLDLFDPKTEKFIHFKHDATDPNSISNNIIRGLTEDSDGNVWIGTNDGVLNKLSAKSIQSLESNPDEIEFIHYTHNASDPKSISSSRWTSSIYEDRAGSIWFGNIYGTIDRVNSVNDNFVRYSHDPADPNTISHNIVTDIFEDESGMLWIGTWGGGLNRYNRNTGEIKHYMHDRNDLTTIGSNIVMYVYELPDEIGSYLWIGTRKGLYHFDVREEKFKRLDYPGLNNRVIQTIIKDDLGYLWIGAWGGVAQLVRDSLDFSGVQSYELINSYIYVKNKRAPHLVIFEDRYQDRDGLWVGSQYQGLKKIDRSNNTYTNYTHDPSDPNSISSNTIWKMVGDEDGTIWLATSNGLNRFNSENETFRHIQPDVELNSDRFSAMIADNNGNLWIGTGNGLLQFDKKTEKFRVYTEDDGLSSNTFLWAQHHNKKTGEMFFGGINGFTSFYPDKIEKNSYIPPVIFTSFKINNEEVVFDTSITFLNQIILPYSNKVFSFEFAALNFINSKKNQYAHILEGFDEDWIYTGNKRDVTYTNLDPGDYLFRVKGSNNDGVWNEEGSSIKITILPPWWETRLAYAIYILLLSASIYGVWRFQVNRLRMAQELEMEHFESKKLREMDDVKSQFFANISHEFRTPLTLILGPLDKIYSKIKDVKIRNELRMMKRSGRNLLRLINQLLDLSRLETGNMLLKTRPENIIPLLRRLVNLFLSQAERKKITLNFNAPKDPIEVYLDSYMFEKILTNLLSNAFKFTPEGGTISVNLSISESIEESSEKVQQMGNIFIEVKDSGVGIAPDQLDRVFDRFYQVDGSHTREQEGTGIGLALTKDLVELHGGEIAVESEEGKGTAFSVKLPLGKDHLHDNEIIEEEQVDEERERDLTSSYLATEISNDLIGKAAKSREKAKRGASKPIVMIVEDNADVRLYVRSYLDDTYRVMEAKNGQDGFIKSTDKIPDLIISDVMMPIMDGFELCKRLKTDERTSHIPVILLTAKADPENKLEGLETGADSYLTKPFYQKELLVRIKNLIDQRKKLRKRFLKEARINPSEITVTSTDEKFLRRAIDTIEQHISDLEYSVDTFSKDIGMSRMALHRKLRALTGRSASGFIRTLRLKRGMTLLQQNSGNVTEVAYEVGFNNPSYFSESFRKEFGKPPSEFIS